MKKRVVRLLPGFAVRMAVYAKRRVRYIRFAIDSLLHRRQMKVFCPCCNMRFRAFVSGGFDLQPNRYDPERYSQTRQDVLCPFCKSLPRHRILAMWCGEHLERLKGKKILYFAPEYGMKLWLKRNRIAVTTADLVRSADQKLDIQDTGLPDGSNDVVFCNHVLEHVDDFRKAIREIHRILKPEGLLLCSFPMDPNTEFLDEEEHVLTERERNRRFGQSDHKRVFGMKADVFLEEAGFNVRTILGEDYPDEIVPAIGPADYDMNRLFQCEKSGDNGQRSS